ncbi:hypothetical protein QTP88_026788 [Uroleucon formosanum]
MYNMYCVGWTNKTTEEKEASREEYDVHILAKEQCREEKSKDSAKGRKGIIKISSRDGYCFVLNEEQANRGVIEIASCLWKYLNEVLGDDLNLQ